MILVDTSVWVAHLRRGETVLRELLGRGRVLAHPWVVGELACGTLGNRDEILRRLRALPPAPVASFAEALRFIEVRRLMGRGLGYVDVNLLASAALAHARLWSFDAALTRAAREMGIGFEG